jgi:hypothetical protein
MKKIEIEIPEGKEVQWVGDTLKLVDIKKPITERIKTFEDAFNLCYNPTLMREYVNNQNASTDLVAYLKLRIIIAALNEGWEPKFTEDEYRYYPWFYFYTKEQYNKLTDEEKECCVLRSGYNTFSYFGFMRCGAYLDASYSSANFGSRLVFKTKELAKYAGKQFIDIYADFYL